MNSKFSKMQPYDLLESAGVDYNNGDCIELEYITSYLDIKIDRAINYDNPDTSGYIKLKKGKPLIWLNPMEGEKRQRFTLAHEIGHYINDILPNFDKYNNKDGISDNEYTLHRSGIIDPMERRANNFALKLLIPQKGLEKFITELNDDSSKRKMDHAIIALAVRFRVSVPIMRYRLKDLGIIKNDYYNT